jgi:hypothetical protein
MYICTFGPLVLNPLITSRGGGKVCGGHEVSSAVAEEGEAREAPIFGALGVSHDDPTGGSHLVKLI